ncbi:MAG TPA: histidine phosphatase family protein [Burkholderiales bacterium]|jgi:probable phosphoglycerate mutase|nr:histidine phosphatase family protein [Burkholderiales bacterium]
MRTEFLLVRHGETAWNAEQRIQGHLDSPLNDEGLAQALLLGERLGQERFDHFYSSDLGRALQTAQPIADRSGRRPVPDPALRERNLGVFQGLTGPECQQRYPQDYARFHQRDPDHAMPGGESIRQVSARVSRLLQDLASRHRGARILVVTHGGVLDAAYRFVNAVPLDRPRDFPIYNASVNRVEYDGVRWRVTVWGDISHLTRDAALDDF